MHIDSFSRWYQYLRFLPVLIFVIALTLTLHLWESEREKAYSRAHAEFNFRVHETIERIRQRLIAYDYVLRGAQGLFFTSSDVSREKFHAYVTNLHLEDRYPGIQGIGFSIIIPPEHRDRHIASERQQTARSGHPEYDIWPHGQRELYTSIVYLEPSFGRNLRAFGYDMFSEPVRRLAMERARDTGMISMSGKVMLVQETNEDVQSGFLVYLPVYRNGVVPSTIEARRSNVLGWVYAPFRMRDLMNGIEGERGGEIDIEIYDGNQLDEQGALYDTDSHLGESIDANMRATDRLEFAGHSWTLLAHSTPSFETRQATQRPEFIAVTGGAASLLLALLTWSLVMGRERAEQAARAMNRELVRSEARAKLAITASHLAAWDFDLSTGRIELSEGWSQLLGGELKSVSTTIQELSTLVPEEERSAAKDSIVRALKGQGSSSYQLVHRIKKYDGSYIWILSEGSVTERDANGRALRMTGTNRDVTERVIAEKKLQELNADLDATLRAIPDMLFEMSESGRYLNVWTRTPELLAEKKESLLGRAVGEVLSAQSAVTVMSAIQEAGKMGYSHGQVIKLDLPGGARWFELSTALKAQTDELDKRFVMLSRDITDRRLAEESLRKLSLAVEQSPTSVIVTDIDANIEYVNQAFVDTTGYRAEEVMGLNPRLLSSGKTPRSDYAEMWRCLKNGEMWRGEFINRRKDGSEYIEAVRMSPVRQLDGSVTHYVAVKEDITERKSAEAKLARSEASLRAILDNVPYLIWLKDAQSRFMAVNRAFFNTTNLATIDEVVGKTDFDLWPKQLAEKYRADDAEVMSTRQQKLTEELSLDGDRPFWVETFKAPVLDQEGNLIGTTGFARDITERKQTEEMVRHMAHHDALTGLPNRAMLSDRIQQSLVKARREKTTVAVLLVDLDKFKPINDTYGHAIGDLLLQDASRRMTSCVRESDTVARLGGDEFVILLQDIEVVQDAVAVAEKVLQSLNQPFELSGYTLEISGSIGIAIAPENGADELVLLKCADAAMYQIKKAGRNGVRLYHPGMENNG